MIGTWRAGRRGLAVVHVNMEISTVSCVVLQEMLGLAHFMNKGRIPEVCKYFREAFRSYMYDSVPGWRRDRDAPHPFVRYGTRSMLLLGDYSRQHGQYEEAGYAMKCAHFHVRPSVEAAITGSCLGNLGQGKS